MTGYTYSLDDLESGQHAYGCADLSPDLYRDVYHLFRIV